MTRLELAASIVVELIRKSGVRETADVDEAERIALTAAFMAATIFEDLEGDDMATSKFLRKPMDGTPKQIVFADHAGDFSPTAANDLRISTDGSNELDAQMAIAGLANGSYWQSAKFDFGALFAEFYDIRGAIEHAATPTAGNAWTLYLAYSDNGTAGIGNSGGASGSSASYTGYSSNAAASVLQLHNIGPLVVTAQATATVQVMEGRRFSPRSRYASLIVLNGSGAAVHSDDVECHIVFNPVVIEGQ